MIVLKENIFTKLPFKFFFTCICGLRNLFSISNFSNSNEIENWNFDFFFFYCYCFACMSVKLRYFEVFILSLWSFEIIASKRALRSYFAKSDNAKVKSSTQNDKPRTSYLIQSAWLNKTRHNWQEIFIIAIFKILTESANRNSIWIDLNWQHFDLLTGFCWISKAVHSF